MISDFFKNENYSNAKTFWSIIKSIEAVDKPLHIFSHVSEAYCLGKLYENAEPLSALQWIRILDDFECSGRFSTLPLISLKLAKIKSQVIRQLANCNDVHHELVLTGLVVNEMLQKSNPWSWALFADKPDSPLLSSVSLSTDIFRIGEKLGFTEAKKISLFYKKVQKVLEALEKNDDAALGDLMKDYTLRSWRDLEGRSFFHYCNTVSASLILQEAGLSRDRPDNKYRLPKVPADLPVDWDCRPLKDILFGLYHEYENLSVNETSRLIAFLQKQTKSDLMSIQHLVVHVLSLSIEKNLSEEAAVSLCKSIVHKNADLLLQPVLLTAIQHGRTDIIAALIECGMSVDCIFQAPLVDTQFIGQSALEVATKCDQHDVKTLLTERGASLELGKSHALFLEKDLYKLLSAKEFTEATLIIKGGLLGSLVVSEQIIDRAVKLCQLHLVDALWENGNFPKISDELIKTIITYHPYWSISFLLKASKKQPHVLEAAGRMLLDNTLSHRLVPIAAFLVSQGFDDSSLTPEMSEQVRHFAKILSGCNEVERDFRLHLGDKFVAGLVGDSFITEMDDDFGNKLEGNNYLELVIFLKKAVAYAAARLEVSEHAEVKKVQRHLQQGHQYMSWVQAARCSENIPELAAATEMMEEQILADLDNLEIGESRFIPLGWKKHGIVLLATKIAPNKFKFQLINPGQGASRHIHASDGVRSGSCTNHYDITRDQLHESHTLQALLEISVSRGFLEKVSRLHVYDDFYSILLPYQAPETRDSKQMELEWRKWNVSHTCAFRSLLNYFKVAFGSPLYHQIIDVIKDDAVLFALEQNIPRVSSSASLSKVYSMAFPHRFDVMRKRFKATGSIDEARLQSLEKGMATFIKNQPALESMHETLSLEANYPTKSKAMVTASRNLWQKPNSLPVHHINQGRVSGYTPFDIRSIRSNQQLIQTLKSVFSACAGECNFLCAITLCQLGRTFLHDQESFRLTSLLEGVRQNPQEGLALIKLLCEMANTVVDFYYTAPYSPINFLSVQYCLIIIWKISCVVDPKLASFGIHSQAFSQVIEEDLRHHVFLNPQWEQDYQLIKNELANCSQGELLFDFAGQSVSEKESKLSNHLAIKMTHAEYQYAKLLVDDHSDCWPKMLVDLEVQLATLAETEEHEPYYDEEEWKIQWTLAHKMPQFFTCLQAVAAICHTTSLGYAVNKNYVNYKLGKLFLIPSKGLTEDRKRATIACYSETKDTKTIATSLPVKSPLSIEPQASDSLCLHEVMQNEIVCSGGDVSLHPIRAIRYAIGEINWTSPLGIPLLIDYFADHMEQLTEPKYQSLFEMSLFFPGRLTAALKSYPNMATELVAFLDDCLLHFDQRAKAFGNDRESINALLFTFTQYQRFLNYCVGAGMPYTEKRSHFRSHIRSLLDNPTYHSPQSKYHLLHILLDSYESQQITTLEDLQDVVVSTAKLRILRWDLPTNSHLPPSYIASVRAIPFMHAASIRRLMKEGQNGHRILAKILALHGLLPPEIGSWQDSSFPFYAFNNQKTAVFEINLLNGLVIADNKTLSGMPDFIKNSPLYKEAFNDKRVKLDCFESVEGWTYSGSDTFGPFKIICKHQTIIEICRTFGGQACRFISKDLLPPDLLKPPFEGYSIWEMRAHPGGLYAVDSSMKERILIDTDGSLIYCDDPAQVRWELVDLERISGADTIQEIDPQAYILQDKSGDNKNPSRLILPNLFIGDNECLEFIKLFLREKKSERWVLKSQKNLFIALNQHLDGIRAYRQFLALESTKEHREALIPVKRFKTIAKKELEQVHCIRVDLHQGNFNTRSPEKNAYLAYLLLTHATTIEDYQLVLKHLKQARKYEPYTNRDIDILKAIIDSQKETSDFSPCSYVCRLYAQWLVTDNRTFHPSAVAENELDYSSPYLDWKTRHTSKSKKIDIYIDREAVGRYFEVREHLPQNMRLENMLTSREFLHWNLYKYIRQASTSQPLDPAKSITSKNVDLDKLLKLAPEGYLTGDLRTRPHHVLHTNFIKLFEIALNGKDVEKAWILNMLHLMSQDADKEVRFLSALLHAALNHATDKKAGAIVKRVQSYDQLKKVKRTKLTTRVVRYAAGLGGSAGKLKAPKIAPFLQTKEALPQIIPASHSDQSSESLTYSTSLDPNLPELEKMLVANFQAIKTEPSTPVKFTYETEDSLITQSIQQLQADYEAGIAKNAIKVRYACLNVESLMKQKNSVRILKTKLQRKISEVEKQILATLNTLPQDEEKQIEQRLGLSSNRIAPLTMADAIHLFARQDPNRYLKLTHLNAAQIGQVHNQIGDYLVLCHQQARCSAVSDTFNVLDGKIKEKEPLESTLEQLAKQLSLKKCYDLNIPFAPAFMAFEYHHSCMLELDQVEAVYSLTRGKNTIVQLLQGKGKTFFVGPLIAFLNADGNTLSTHIPGSSQATSTLYDMGHNGDVTFGQRQDSFTFDDDPKKFTEAFLIPVQALLEEAIVNRDYVTLSKETLRAMRSKYIKMRFLLQETPDAKLEKINQALKSILRLFRKKAVFAMDEVHEALDPLNELCMPFGASSPPNLDQYELMCQIMRIACSAKDDKGQYLLSVHDSSLQSSAQYKLMIKEVIKVLCKQAPWNAPEIKEYITGETSELPQALTAPERRDEANLVILARLMLTEDLLKSRLKSSVDEDHGLCEGSPRISVPLIANMKRAGNSEYSDTLIVGLNTILDYLDTGLNSEQVDRFIPYCRQIALQEQKSTNCSTLLDTTIAKDFTTAFSIGLYDNTATNADLINNMLAALKANQSIAMRLVLDFVLVEELKKVEIFKRQAGSNAQNTVSMARGMVGYSANIGENMAPLDCEVVLDFGTNGQTIDLLISKGELIAVPRDAKKLIKLGLQRPRLRTFIDVGVHFRGIPNDRVGQMIGKRLRKNQSEVQGVLFFEPGSGKLSSTHRDNLGNTTKLSGSSADTIAQETGLDDKSLITYYDEEHITGTNLRQMPTAEAIVTVKETTTMPKLLQGARRMRDLDGLQRILMGLPYDVMLFMQEMLRKDSLSTSDVVLFTNILEAEAQRENNLPFALQKLVNEFEQLVLDRLYALPQSEEIALFAKVGSIFAKETSTDLVTAYTNQRQSVETPEYLIQELTKLKAIVEIAFTKEEVSTVCQRISDQIMTPRKLKEMRSHVSITSNINRVSQSMHIHEAHMELSRLHDYNHCRDQEIHRNVEHVKDDCVPSTQEIAFTLDQFASPSLGESINIIDLKAVTNPEPGKAACIWSLQQVLQYEIEDAVKVDTNILVTSNACLATDTRMCLAGGSKSPYALLLICDLTEDKQVWKLIIGSMMDGTAFDVWIREQSNALPADRAFWLFRSNGEIASTSPNVKDINPLENLTAAALVAEARTIISKT
ncbi:MAG: hypothetical protein Q8K75_04645 [Chlamydiales bacterium]|nr:hypothetical protein [Chlamydiales bacterium]